MADQAVPLATLQESEKAINELELQLLQMHKQIVEQTETLRDFEDKTQKLLTSFEDINELMDNAEELKEARRRSLEELELIRGLQKQSLENLEAVERAQRMNEENRQEMERTRARIAELQVSSPMSQQAERSFGEISEISTSFEVHPGSGGVVLHETSSSSEECYGSSSDTLEETSDTSVTSEAST